MANIWLGLQVRFALPFGVVQRPEFDQEFKPVVQSRGPAIGVVLAGLAVALMGDALGSGVFLWV